MIGLRGPEQINKNIKIYKNIQPAVEFKTIKGKNNKEQNKF